MSEATNKMRKHLKNIKSVRESVPKESRAFFDNINSGGSFLADVLDLAEKFFTYMEERDERKKKP